MDYEQVSKGVEDGSMLVIDVRGPDEVAKTGKIPNSINIPIADLEGAMASKDDFKEKFGVESPAKDAKIVTHCQKGGRAKRASDALQALGFSNANCYPGSFTDWLEKGGQVEKK